jgi:uncharacterized protein (TIGR02118 family)
MKLIALYKHPEDESAFEDKYFNSHLPLIRKVPGLEDIVVTRFTRCLMGDDFFMMAEMQFGDSETLKAAMRSPEMAAAGENLNSFAEGLTTLLYGSEQEEPIKVE